MITAIVIDDNKDAVAVFCEFLQIRGIEIIGSGYDGNQAVELYEKLRPDIVFVDVMMGRYDGFYALEKIRENHPNAFVVMVTADMTTVTQDRLNELKASATIYKPYDIDEVMRVVCKLVLHKSPTKN